MELATYTENNLPFYLDMLQQMVAINSFTANPAGVDALGDLTAAAFAELGFKAERAPSNNAAFGDHLILTRPGNGRHKIGLISHLDTVFPPEEEVRNAFHWREEGDRIYGPGTVDIKGGTVLIYMLLDALRETAPKAFAETTWVVLMDAAEEADGVDFGRLCRERLDEGALAALIFEGGYREENNFWAVVARKGMAKYRITADGRSAHAGTAHHQGANAIVQMADVVQQLHALTDYEKDLTVNVGAINGGVVVNRVPHFAAAEVEMRAFTPEVYREAQAAIEALDGYSSVSSADGYPCRVGVAPTRKTAPWPRNPATDRLLAVWQKAGDKLGYHVIPEERGGLSDGNFFWESVPTLDGLGPSGGNAHCSERNADGSKDQEFCYPGSFVPKTVLNATAVLDLLGRPDE